MYRAFSSDLGKTLAQPFGNFTIEKLPLSSKTTEQTPYLRDATGECFTPTPGDSFVEKGCFSPLLTASNVPAETEVEGKKRPREFGGHVNTVTADASLSHVVLAASGTTALSSEPAGPNGNIYDYYEGQAHLVSILPNGKPAGEKPAGFEPPEQPGARRPLQRRQGDVQRRDAADLDDAHERAPSTSTCATWRRAKRSSSTCPEEGRRNRRHDRPSQVPDRERRRVTDLLHRRTAPDEQLHRRCRATEKPTSTSARCSKKRKP